jgi:hypothetical protein
LDFQNEYPIRGQLDGSQIASNWLDADLHRNYNGEYFDGTQMRLAPTFSIGYSMNCPLNCSFCYYANALPNSRPTFTAVVAEIERIWSHGHRHFYFTDPNLLLSTAEFEELTKFRESTGGAFGFYCQVSPNFLNLTRLQQLAASG